VGGEHLRCALTTISNIYRCYYDTHQSGVLLSTITADVLTIQNFASSATLGIVVDMFTSWACWW